MLGTPGWDRHRAGVLGAGQGTAASPHPTGLRLKARPLPPSKGIFLCRWKALQSEPGRSGRSRSPCLRPPSDPQVQTPWPPQAGGSSRTPGRVSASRRPADPSQGHPSAGAVRPLEGARARGHPWLSLPERRRCHAGTKGSGTYPWCAPSATSTQPTSPSRALLPTHTGL